MAAYIDDTVLDAALNQIKNNAENLYICSTQPTTFVQASATYKLGTKAAPAFTGPANGDTSGRKLTVSAISGGTVSAGGSAGFFAITDDSASVLLVAGPLNAAQTVAAGNTFSLTTFDIELPDPA